MADQDRLSVAEQALDAFYRWDKETLVGLLAPGDDADRLLYYQAWAEAAHYSVRNRANSKLSEPGTSPLGPTCQND